MTAKNIKSRITRSHVQESLSKCISCLKLYQSQPKKGIILFAKHDKLIEIEPPVAVNKNMYLCSKTFDLNFMNYVKSLYKVHDENGVVLVSGQETRFYKVSPISISLKKTIRTKLAKKHKKGGQSAQRFGRIREEKCERYLTMLVESILEEFYDFKTHTATVKKLIICGPSIWKHKLINHNLIKS